MHRAKMALALLATWAAAPAGAAEGTATAAGADPAPATTTTSAKTAYGAYPNRLSLPGNVDRTIGGHVFTPALLVRSPFALTQVGADLLYGAGTADGKKPSIIDRDRGDATYEFATMGQNFYYDARVADGVAVGGGLTVQFYSGITGPSAVVLGLEVGAGLFGRVTAGRQYGPFRAALTFDASYAPQYGLHILEAVESYAGTASDSITRSALTSSNGWTVKPGFSAAFAASPALGLTLSADYQGVWVDTNQSGWQYTSGVDAGLALDVDFGTFTRTPLAAVGAFRITAPIGPDGLSTVIDYTVGAFYTGRPPLVLGAEVGQRRFEYRDLDAVANIIQFRVQYLW